MATAPSVPTARDHTRRPLTSRTSSRAGRRRVTKRDRQVVVRGIGYVPRRANDSRTGMSSQTWPTRVTPPAAWIASRQP
jgi:hypothetical protein